MGNSCLANSKWGEGDVDCCENRKGHNNDWNAVLPRRHIDNFQVRQFVWRLARLDLGASPQQNDVNNECGYFKVEEVQRNGIHQNAVYNDVNNNGELRCEVRDVLVEHTHHCDSQNRYAVVAPHLIQEGADASRQIHEERSDHDGSQAKNNAEALSNRDFLLCGALLLGDNRQNIKGEQRHGAVEYRVEG